MKVIDALSAALEAVTPAKNRPATAAVYDAAAVRLVVFRIEPGQEVAAHSNEGTVLLTVLSGSGTVGGGTESQDVGPGAVVAYAPGESHAMKAGAERFCLMATIIRSHG